jgi:hypothetical protein
MEKYIYRQFKVNFYSTFAEREIIGRNEKVVFCIFYFQYLYNVGTRKLSVLDSI